MGLDFRELIDPEDRRDVGERYRAWEQSEAVAGGLEARIRSRQGDLKRVHVRAGSLLFEGKRSVIATVRDVTRERRMEREIKDHAERLAAINEIAGAVNQSLTIEDIFSVAAQETRRIVPFDRLIDRAHQRRSGGRRAGAGGGRPRQPPRARSLRGPRRRLGVRAPHRLVRRRGRGAAVRDRALPRRRPRAPWPRCRCARTIG